MSGTARFDTVIVSARGSSFGQTRYFCCRMGVCIGLALLCTHILTCLCQRVGPVNSAHQSVELLFKADT